MPPLPFRLPHLVGAFSCGPRAARVHRAAFTLAVRYSGPCTHPLPLGAFHATLVRSYPHDGLENFLIRGSQIFVILVKTVKNQEDSIVDMTVLGVKSHYLQLTMKIDRRTVLTTSLSVLAPPGRTRRDSRGESFPPPKPESNRRRGRDSSFPSHRRRTSKPLVSFY